MARGSAAPAIGWQRVLPSPPLRVDVFALSLAAALLALVHAGSLGHETPSLDATVAPAAPGPPLNIVHVVVDDLRPSLGAYGLPGRHTPHMDSLAAQGVTFDAAYTQYAVWCGSPAGVPVPASRTMM